MFIGHLIPQAYRHFIYLDCFNITLGDLNCGRSTTHPSKSENSYANDIDNDIAFLLAFTVQKIFSGMRAELARTIGPI